MNAKAHEGRSARFHLPTEADTIRFGQQLAAALANPCIMVFSGAIGAGKTTMVRAMLREAGVQSAIKSPSYTLVESYHCHGMPVHHLDLYRIQDPEELEFIGIREYLDGKAVCLVEWPEHAHVWFEHADLQVHMGPDAGFGRIAEVCARTPMGTLILSSLSGDA